MDELEKMMVEAANKWVRWVSTRDRRSSCMRKPVYNVVGAYSNEVIYQADEHAEAFRFILQSFPNDTKDRNPKFEKMKRINRKGYVLPQPMRIEKAFY